MPEVQRFPTISGAPPVSLNPGLAKAIGVMMKLDFQRAVLNRIPEDGEGAPDKYFRQVFFMLVRRGGSGESPPETLS